MKVHVQRSWRDYKFDALCGFQHGEHERFVDSCDYKRMATVTCLHCLKSVHERGVRRMTNTARVVEVALEWIEARIDGTALCLDEIQARARKALEREGEA